MSNTHTKTVAGFGYEWTQFDQSIVSENELRDIFESYFLIFPWKRLPENAIGFDLGCGSGRWAQFVAPQIGLLHCIDASEEAIEVAKKNLQNHQNCQFHAASVDNMDLQDSTMDFGYSLGVLHHIPRPLEGIQSCVAKLKPGAPLLLYLYYAFDNRPVWFRVVWKISDIIRQIIAQLPNKIKLIVCSLIALLVYWPLSRFAHIFEKLGFDVDAFPLSAYRSCSLYTLRTDAFDRFGTRLEHRFTASEIKQMMEDAGLERITFSDSVPYWCAVGYRKKN